MRRTTSVAVAMIVLGLSTALSGCTPSDPAPSTAPSAASAALASAAPTPTPTPIVDAGPREGAMGTVEVTASGEFRYTVVDGDVGGLVCERFGRDWWQLDRVGAGQAGFDCFTMIAPGDVLIPTAESRAG